MPKLRNNTRAAKVLTFSVTFGAHNRTETFLPSNTPQSQWKRALKRKYPSLTSFSRS